MSSTRSQIFHDYSLETTAKDAARFPVARDVLPLHAAVNIAFIGNETFADRLQAVQTLHECGTRPRPIISARRIENVEILDAFLDQAVERGVDGLFLVGGDPSKPKGPFKDSLELINNGILDKHDIKTVGIAGYPEGHPRITNELLWKYLKYKVEVLLDRDLNVEITTQLSFNTEAVISWIKRVRYLGINVPIRIGLPSPSSLGEMLNFARQCRVGTSVQLLQRYGWQASSFLGSVGPDKFLGSLINKMEQQDLGEIKLHIYPLGDLSKALLWVKNSYASL